MTQEDRQILFTGLAFLAVIMKGESVNPSEDDARVVRLAKMFDEFCTRQSAENTPAA